MPHKVFWYITQKELKTLFLSPLAWVIMALVQLIVSYQFLAHLESFLQLQGKMALQEKNLGVTDLVIAPLMAGVALVLLLITPLLTMRLISEERKNQTLTLLMSAPIPMYSIILGKFLSIVLFQVLMLLVISLMPLSLYWGTQIDMGQLVTAILGLSLALSAFAAAGLYLSTLTAQPVVAAISGFGLLLILWLLSWGIQTESGFSLLAYLSLLTHLEPFLYGTFSSADVIYFVLFIVFFLVLAIKRLDVYRLPH